MEAVLLAFLLSAPPGCENDVCQVPQMPPAKARQVGRTARKAIQVPKRASLPIVRSRACQDARRDCRRRPRRSQLLGRIFRRH